MKIIYLIFLILIIVVQSCGERTLIRHYYILEFPATGDSLATSAIQGEGTCEIFDSKIPPAYAQQRIAVRQQSHEISYYQYHYWAMNPSENLTTLLEHRVQLSHIFNSAKSGLLKKIPDYQISSQVYKLEALDSDDIFYARLEMDLELIDYKSEKIIVTHRFDRTQILENRDLNLFASALSEIFQEEVDQFITKIGSYFGHHTRQIPADKSN